jgi:uncharacterized protein
MSGALPELVDAWRMVASGRVFEGQLPLASMTRLADSLADTTGDVAYAIEFGKDDFGISFIDVRVDARLPMICQRSLERFEQPVSIEQRLGLIASERDEAGLPEGYEPVLLDGSADLRLATLIEDELILALPVVPLKDGADDDSPLQTWSTASAEELEELEAEAEKPNPFAALATLKQDRP